MMRVLIICGAIFYWFQWHCTQSRSKVVKQAPMSEMMPQRLHTTSAMATLPEYMATPLEDTKMPDPGGKSDRMRVN